MSFRVRHCVGCPSSHTRHLLAKNRYANGSYVVVHRLEEFEKFTLYCSAADRLQSAGGGGPNSQGTRSQAALMRVVTVPR